MSIVTILRQPIWQYQRDHIAHLYEARKNLKIKSTRIGINASIVLHIACCIEGYLENELKSLLGHRYGIMNSSEFKQFPLRRIYHAFINNIKEDFETRISRTTGLERFDSLIDILSFRTKPERLADFKYFEGIRVLFHLRNVLAHGREVTAQTVSGYWTDGSCEERFSGGYRRAESYLIKTKLIKTKFTECHDIEWLFTNKVTDHFHLISKQFLQHCSSIFEIEKNETSLAGIIERELSNSKTKPSP